MGDEGMRWRIRLALNHLFDSHPDRVAQASVHPTMQGWFTGQVMKSLDGEPDIEMVKAAVERRFHAPTP
jgi:Asp-tRNA(Asn)/Glu-tRNA(Gln) amidotransferase B subunit